MTCMIMVVNSLSNSHQFPDVAMVTGHMSIQLRCVQTRWRADTDDYEEK